MASNDLNGLERCLAADLHYVHANGMVEDKPEFLRKIASGERTYRRFSSITRQARRESDLTFVFGEAEVEVDRAAGPLKNRLTYTAIYRNTRERALFTYHACKSISS
jgi:hypothetical protein